MIARAMLLGLALAQFALPARAQQPEQPGKTPPATPPAKTPPPIGSPKVKDSSPSPADSLRWFPEIDRQVTTPAGGNETIGEFAFANPTDQTIEWRDFGASCSCAKCSIRVGDRHYDVVAKPREIVQIIATDGQVRRVPVDAIPVGPWEVGQLDVHVDAHVKAARKVVSVDVFMTDPATPMARLRLEVLSSEPVVVIPERVDLQTVAPGSRRQFTLLLASSVKDDFKILGAELPPDVTATWTRIPTADGVKWRVLGEFVATGARTAADGYLKFETDIPTMKVVSVLLHARVEPLVAIKPTVMAFGQIRKGTKGVAAVLLEPKDASDLRAKRVHFENLNVDASLLTVQTRKDGRSLVVVVEVAPTAPDGLLHGDVVVELDHPTLPSQRIPFNGTVQ